MREMTWQQWLFVLCFCAFGVGGTWWVASESLTGAIITLVVMTLVGTGVWLGLVYWIRQGLQGTADPPTDR